MIGHMALKERTVAVLTVLQGGERGHYANRRVPHITILQIHTGHIVNIFNFTLRIAYRQRLTRHSGHRTTQQRTENTGNNFLVHTTVLIIKNRWRIASCLFSYTDSLILLKQGCESTVIHPCLIRHETACLRQIFSF